MKSLNLTRITMGIIVIAGLLFFKPLAYFAAGMMIFAGLTGICFLEKFFSRFFSSGTSCSVAARNPCNDLQRMTPEDIKQAVREKYSQVASIPGTKFNFPVGRKFAESVGYSRELLDKLPEDRIIQATSFKKVYEEEMEFIGYKKDLPTQKLVNYIDNQALEKQSPKILDKLDSIQNERLEFNKAMILFTDQLKGFGIEIKEHRGVIKDIRKYIGIIAGFKQKKMKITENQTNLSRFIYNKI